MHYGDNSSLCIYIYIYIYIYMFMYIAEHLNVKPKQDLDLIF